MQGSLLTTWARGVALAVALAAPFGCAKKPHAGAQPSASALTALPPLPEPAGVLAELRLAQPDSTYRAFRELGRPLSSLLPASFPMLAATLAGLPPLSADSFDTDLPTVGLLLQSATGEPGWVLAAHVLSGPELVAKLTTGDHAPFRAVTASAPGLKVIQPSPEPGTTAAAASFSLAVFDNYLLVGSSAELVVAAGPYTARMLPRRAPAAAPVAVRVGERALDSNVVPALRALWAGYRTRLAHSDQSERSAHGGRPPDFADPAQVILGADALVESLFALLDGASALEVDLAPSPNRLDVTLALEPQAGSEAQQKLASLAPGNARSLLRLPIETEFALGLSRSAAEREAAGKTAGDDWARLLGARLSERDTQQLRAVLSDWELGRGTETEYGFLGGTEPGAFLMTQVADATRLKRAGSGLFGLLGLPGLRAPLAEFLGQPRVLEGAAPAEALPNVTRKKVVFSPVAGRPPTPPLSFAWLVDEQSGFAAASKNGDLVLKTLVQSATGARPSLSAQPGLPEAVGRVGEQAALFAYLDARLAFGVAGAGSAEPAPLLLSLAKGASGANLRIELSKPALDLVLRAVTGQ